MVIFCIKGGVTHDYTNLNVNNLCFCKGINMSCTYTHRYDFIMAVLSMCRCIHFWNFMNMEKQMDDFNSLLRDYKSMHHPSTSV